ncbi:MAG: hypothetical protein KAJ10_13660 [Thermodesulfovibrionia bacterium]|nr:hypothetical protein [Thermodesulfovibrionia bacterium]
MAIVRGGLHGRPSGNVAGVVYGAARTRTGKAVTARELVFPSNPKTAAQVLQRAIFTESLAAVRRLTASLWQDDFNRSIGQLPGFHSMMSIVMLGTNASEEFISPADTPLGNLHFPGTFTVVTGAGAAGTVQIDWTNELGLNGTVNDELIVFCISKDAISATVRYAVQMTSVAVRSDVADTPNTGVIATDVVVGCYFKGTGTADGLLSPCKWFDVLSHA